MINADFRGAAMVLCAMFLAGGFTAILWSALSHYRRGIAKQTNFHRTVVAEVCWTLVPCLMVAGLIWPVVRDLLST